MDLRQLNPAQLAEQLEQERAQHAEQLRQHRQQLEALQRAYRERLSEHRQVFVQVEQLMPYMRPENMMFALRRDVLVGRLKRMIDGIDEFSGATRSVTRRG